MDNNPSNLPEEVRSDLNTESINDNVAGSQSIGDPEKSNADVLSQVTPEGNEDSDKDPIAFIKYMLESKSAAKQTTFTHLARAFEMMSHESQRIINEISTASITAEDVTLYHRIINKHEFQVKLAGDLLIFVMHTNIITFDPDHGLMKESYIRSNPVNRYFGQINIYNFMYDSMKYGRGNDPGYLIGRLMINHEGRFFMEGEETFTSRYGRISETPIDGVNLQDIVKHSLQIAIQNDLMAIPYERVKLITLNQKNEHTIELGGGQKIGFQMSYQDRMEN